MKAFASKPEHQRTSFRSRPCKLSWRAGALRAESNHRHLNHRLWTRTLSCSRKTDRKTGASHRWIPVMKLFRSCPCRIFGRRARWKKAVETNLSIKRIFLKILILTFFEITIFLKSSRLISFPSPTVFLNNCSSLSSDALSNPVLGRMLVKLEMHSMMCVVETKFEPSVSGRWKVNE